MIATDAGQTSADRMAMRRRAFLVRLGYRFVVQTHALPMRSMRFRSPRLYPGAGKP